MELISIKDKQRSKGKKVTKQNTLDGKDLRKGGSLRPHAHHLNRTIGTTGMLRTTRVIRTMGANNS